MKVLFITNYREDIPNGAAIVAYELAQEFSKVHETAILHPGKENRKWIDEDGLTHYTVKSVGISHLNFNKLSTDGVDGILHFVEEFSPDVVHSHSYIDIALVVFVWAIKTRTPYFLTVHSLPSKLEEWGQLETTGGFTVPLVKIAVKRYILPFYNDCTAIIALNENAAQDLRKAGYKGPIEKVPNGRKLELFTSQPFTDITQELKILTFVGSIEKRKNQAFLAEVITELPLNYHLNLVGDEVDPVYSNRIHGILDKGEITNYNIPGALPSEEIPKVLGQTHIFVSASTAELQSLVIMEAMASGTPVVGISNQTVDEFIDDSVGKNLPKDSSPEEFAREVQNICNLDQKNYETICQNARQKMSEYDWSNVRQKTVQMYKKYLENPPRNPDSIIIKQINSIFSHLPDIKTTRFLKERINIINERDNNKAPKNKVGIYKHRKWALLSLATAFLSVAIYFLVKIFRSRLIKIFIKDEKRSTKKK
ncbi:glycosyltransferase [Candidatus Dojkabacteria bacterium]|nr:glycosyltransferase [Candidatus Dojkabacteria bacterium]